MFCQNFRIFEKKLAEGSACLVYNGIYNGKNLQEPKFFSLGTKTHLYELICHPHIEEDKTRPVCFLKKISLIKTNLINWRFMIFAVTLELHCNGKNLKSQINLIFLDQNDFFHKTDLLSLVLLYMVRNHRDGYPYINLALFLFVLILVAEFRTAKGEG